MAKRASKDLAISETMQALRRIIKAIQDYSQDISNQFGVTGPQLWALKTIFEHGDLSLSELSRRMYLHPSTMTGVVDRMEKKGLVARKRDAGDRRVVKLQITSEGASLIRKAPNPIQGKMIYGLRRLRRQELDSIFRAIQKLTQIMEAQHIRVKFFFDQE